MSADLLIVANGAACHFYRWGPRAFKVYEDRRECWRVWRYQRYAAFWGLAPAVIGEPFRVVVGWRDEDYEEWNSPPRYAFETELATPLTCERDVRTLEAARLLAAIRDIWTGWPGGSYDHAARNYGRLADGRLVRIDFGPESVGRFRSGRGGGSANR